MFDNSFPALRDGMTVRAGKRHLAHVHNPIVDLEIIGKVTAETTAAKATPGKKVSKKMLLVIGILHNQSHPLKCQQ